MYKFAYLIDYLKRETKDDFYLDLMQIEKIARVKLCKSAYEYPEYWYTCGKHSLATQILDCGFEVKPDLKIKKIKFIRVGTEIMENIHSQKEGKEIITKIRVGSRITTIRDAYLEKYGYSCKLCGKSYLKANGKDYIIEVHHLNPIKNGERKTDINNDLRGLCPNCHKFVHSIDDFENKTWGEIEKIFKEINKV